MRALKRRAGERGSEGVGVKRIALRTRLPKSSKTSEVFAVWSSPRMVSGMSRVMTYARYGIDHLPAEGTDRILEIREVWRG
jgi:hypothetical protein